MTDEKQVPEIFDRATDTVLAYRPKPKTKAAKRRARRKKKKANQCMMSRPST
jgi:hypothetical protein